jgi:hypothetical protein
MVQVIELPTRSRKTPIAKNGKVPPVSGIRGFAVPD